MAATTRTAALVILIGTLILFVSGGARFAIGLTLKPVEAELAGGRSLVGLAVAVFQAVQAVAMFWAGRLADRIDLNLVLGLGTLCAGIGIGLLALVTAPWQIVALYGVVFGIGSGMASLIPVGVLVTRHAPERAALANSIAIAGNGLGQLVLMAVMTPALAVFGWRGIYLWLGALHLVLVPMILREIGALRGRANPPGHAPAAGTPPAPGLGLREAARTGRFWLLLAIYSLCGLQDFFVSTHLVAFAQDRGADAFFAGNLLAAMGLLMVLGVLFAGWASDRFGPVTVTVIAFLLRVAMFTAVLYDQSTSTVAAFALVFGATFLMTAPLVVVFVREAFGTRHLGALSGFITMVHHICGGLGALAGAALFDARGNYEAVLWAMLATSVMGALLALGLRRRA